MDSMNVSPRGIVPISKNVVQMMRNRLDEVEDSTMQLTKEIINARETGCTDRFSVLLSKTQSMETILQSLKLNFVNLSTLTRQPSDLEHKLVEMTDFYGEEIKKLSNENSHLKSDKIELKERKQQLEVELQRLRIAFEDGVITQRERDEIIQVEKERASKLLLKITEQDRLLNEERQARFNLDRLNQEMEQKLNDVESVVRREHLQSEKFTSEFLALKKGYAQKNAELENERRRLQDMEIEMGTICSELDSKVTALKTLKDEKEMITKEMSTVHDKYSELNEQLTKMHAIFESHQKEKSNLETKCLELAKSVDGLKAENSSLTSELIKSQAHDESAKVISLREQLRHLNKQRDELINDNELLSSRLEDLDTLNDQLQHELDELRERSTQDEAESQAVETLQRRLESLKKELLALESEKGAILTEVDSTVDATSSERLQLQAEVDLYREQLSAALDQLEAEKIKTEELSRERGRHKSQRADKKDFVGLDKFVADLTNQKNSLSYENGKLQSQCEELEAQLALAKQESLSNNKLNNKLRHTESKLHKTRKELESLKSSLTHAEEHIPYLEGVLHEREDELAACSKALSDSMNDAKFLQERVSALEETLAAQEKANTSVQQAMMEDGVKTSTSLESMVALHTEMQVKYEAAQIDLGRKDEDLTRLRQEISRLNSKSTKMEERLYKSDKLCSELETTRDRLNSNLVKELKEQKEVNNTLTKSVHDSLEKTQSLIRENERLEQKLTRIKSELTQALSDRTELASRLQLCEGESKKKISQLEAELSEEKDKTYEKLEGQLRSMQRETQSIIDRNSELLSTNSALKSELEETHRAVNESRRVADDVSNQLAQTQEKYTKAKRSLQKSQEKHKELSTSVSRERKDRKSLVKKCESQQQTIDHFVSQFKELQVEMKQLVHLHREQTELLRDKEGQLQQEVDKCDQLELRLAELHKQVKEAQKEQKALELRLVESNNETLLAADAFEDMESFFKQKFCALTHELSTARKQKLTSEWKAMETEDKYRRDRQRIETTASHARHMLEASRRTVTRLADSTEKEMLERERRTSQSPQRSPSKSLRFSSPRHDLSQTSVPDLDTILQSSQLSLADTRNYHNLSPRSINRNNLSPFATSSQKLDALIQDMERQNMI